MTAARLQDLSAHGTSIISLDVGDVRIGVAIAQLAAAFPRPLTTLPRSVQSPTDILNLCKHESAAAIVLGLPRSLDGEDTAQTRKVRAFRDELEQVVAIPLYWCDEALTSHKAESELNARGRAFTKADIDALAATYILEDFIKEFLITTTKQL